MNEHQKPQCADGLEVVARLLGWKGPSHMPIPHDGVCARTYAEFPENYYPDGYWAEGEKLCRLTDAQRLAAKLREELAQRDAEIAGLRQHKTDYMEAAEGTRRALEARIAELEAPMLEWTELDYTKHTRRSLMAYIGQQNFKITAQAKRIDSLQSHIRTDNTETLANALARIKELESQQAASVGGDSAWFALAMNAGAYLEDAANCLSDQDAKRAALGAALHVRTECNALRKARRASVGGEEIQIVGVRISSDGFGSYIADSAMGIGAMYPGDVREPLMTVAQHQRIVAALSPAGGGVVMPEEKVESVRYGYRSLGYSEGWNAAIAEVARLNAKPQANSQEAEE